MIQQAFPASLHADLEKVLGVFYVGPWYLFWRKEFWNLNSQAIGPYVVNLDGTQFTIPYRIASYEPLANRVAALAPLQQTMLHCIFLRHNNGWVRQQHLSALLGSTADFVVPFTLPLLGEYVVEIIAVLDEYITGTVLANRARFANENEAYWQRTQRRVVSYWNEYYRHQYPRLADYPGTQLVHRIEAARMQLLKP